MNENNCSSIQDLRGNQDLSKCLGVQKKYALLLESSRTIQGWVAMILPSVRKVRMQAGNAVLTIPVLVVIDWLLIEKY